MDDFLFFDSVLTSQINAKMRERLPNLATLYHSVAVGVTANTKLAVDGA